MKVDTMSAKEKVLAVHKEAVCRHVLLGSAEWYQVDTTPESRKELGSSFESVPAAWEDAASHLPALAERTEPQSLTVAGGEDETDLARTLRTGLGSCITITASDEAEGRRVVAGWPDDKVREYAINWVARAEARQRLADDAIHEILNLRNPLEASPSPATPAEGHPSEPLPAPSALDMEAVVSQTFSVPFTCPNCSDCDERVANLNAFIRELQKREDAPLAFYRGRREVLDLLDEFFVGNVRLVIHNELQKNLGRYEEPR